MSAVDYAFAHGTANDEHVDRDLAAPPRPARHARTARADAELAVGQFLAGLGARWHVLHGVPLGGRREIAHVAIGPAGVFTVMTRHHPGALLRVDGDTVTVDGRDERYVRAARHEADHAAVRLTARALFDVEVRGIVAVTGARAVLPLALPPDVDVLEAHELVRHLRSLRDVLGAPSVERIYEVARHLATWQPDVAWSPLSP